MNRIICLSQQPYLKQTPKQTLRRAKTVCFDVDSTVCRTEGIDELARWYGVGDQVALMTKKAMAGRVSFHDALRDRLELIRPTEQALYDFIHDNPPQLSPGVHELIQTLRAHDKDIFLVSGGFFPMIVPVADLLEIPLDHIYATKLFFENGLYAGFETFSKSSVLESKKDQRPIVMIGDGATDLETKLTGHADLFIGYGGVVKRPTIKDRADWFVNDFDEIISVFNS